MRLIRKISIGVDLKNSMNFQVGVSMMAQNFTVHEILESETAYNVYIKCEIDSDDQNKGEIVLWKTFLKTMPIAVEYSIDF